MKFVSLLLLAFVLFSCGPEIIESDVSREDYQGERFTVFPGTLNKIEIWPDSADYDGIREIKFYYTSEHERTLSVYKYPDWHLVQRDSFQVYLRNRDTTIYLRSSTLTFVEEHLKAHSKGSIQVYPFYPSHNLQYEYRNPDGTYYWGYSKINNKDYLSKFTVVNIHSQVLDVEKTGPTAYPERYYLTNRKYPDDGGAYKIFAKENTDPSPLQYIYPPDNDFFRYFWRFHIRRGRVTSVTGPTINETYEYTEHNGRVREILLSDINNTNKVVARFHWN